MKPRPRTQTEHELQSTRDAKFINLLMIAFACLVAGGLAWVMWR